MFARLSCLILISLLISLVPAAAQTLPPCTERANWTFNIRAKPEYYCVEFVLQDASAGEMSFTALAFAPDGRLFAARPLQGQVLMLRDTDGDTQPDSPQVIAEGLDRPNALLYADGALYIAGGSSVYRLRDDSEIEILIDNLPSGTGLWNGGLAINGTDLFVGIGTCDGCPDHHPWRGTLYHMPMAGGVTSVYAARFRQPLGLLWHNNVLWATDSLGSDTAGDSLNQVPSPDDACSARTDVGAIACPTSPLPVLTLPAGSQPSALTVYTGEAFPHLQGKMLIALMGSVNRSDVRGYGVIAFDIPQPDSPTTVDVLLPYDKSITSGAAVVSSEGQIATLEDMSFLNRRGVGLWPHHLYGMAVSPEGWIYLSVGGGTILSLRPR